MSNRNKNVANHYHRYKKKNIGRDGKEYYVYFCTKPGCSHYIPINLAEGRLCECNYCAAPMIITKAVLTHSSSKPMTRPHCGACTKRRKESDVEAITEFLEGVRTTPPVNE